jgi:hypothetical protein
MTAMLLFAALSAGQVTSGESEWLTDYGVALERCKGQGRPLLIVIDRPGRPVARFEQTGYSPSDRSTRGPQDYVLCHIDGSTRYGQAVAAAFQASSLPYTAIIDKRGKGILYAKHGEFSSEEWATTLSSYRAGVRLVAYQPVASQTFSQPAQCST